MIKRISIDQLRPGMYIVGLDKSWWQTPFLFHNRLIAGEEDIVLLGRVGVREITIDSDQGRDVEEEQQSGRKSDLFPSVFPSVPPQQRKFPLSSLRPENNPSRLLPSQQSPAAALFAELPAARAVREEALTTTQILFEGVKTGAPIASAAVKQAVNGLLESILRHPAASLLLVQMRQFDPTLLTHSVDVCVLSLVVGKERELTLDQLRILGAGALLHDIGHLRLPRNLRWQPHSYTPQQRKLLRAHPHLGVAILAQTLGITEDSREIVATHHERVNGSGYPEGRRAAEIPRLSQIVAIADTYDKLVSGWTGQPGLPPTSALRHLYQQGRAGLFDDKQIALTIRAFGVYPVGTLVELNTGERAVVLSLNPHETLRPTVRIITTREPQSPRGAQIVDLATQIDGAPIRSIVRALEPTTAQIKLGDYF